MTDPTFSPLHLIIALPLLFILFFGVGFVVNMLLRTTWLPIIIFLGCSVWVGWNTENLFTIPNFVFFAAGLAGCFVGIWTIRTLRIQGYKMF